MESAESHGSNDERVGYILEELHAHIVVAITEAGVGIDGGHLPDCAELAATLARSLSLVRDVRECLTGAPNYDLDGADIDISDNHHDEAVAP